MSATEVAEITVTHVCDPQQRQAVTLACKGDVLMVGHLCLEMSGLRKQYVEATAKMLLLLKRMDDLENKVEELKTLVRRSGGTHGNV